ncbi:MAG: super-infection exclusion protein B [Gammaproteobacteria bacterium]|nr:super-infection exclusion protein B [Gammaproteobacteria bacterium]
MNPADPRWLEILKASGWQTSLLTIACVLILVLISKGVIPTTGSPLWIAVPAIGAIVFGSLSLAAIGSALVKFIQPGVHIKLWLKKGQKLKEVRELIPFMSDKDKEILGYLLYKNQRMFQSDQDGGYAAPLISKGIIKISVSVEDEQFVHSSWVPFEIPDYIWRELVARKEMFPYSPPGRGKTEVYPWAIDWRVR